MLSAAIRARSAFVRRRRPLGPSITSSRETPTPLEPSKWTSILPSLSKIQTLRHAHARRLARSAPKWQEVVGVALTVKAAGARAVELNDKVEVEDGAIAISTMHFAKGLEFRSVVVMACDDDVIPQTDRIEAVADDADLEEVYNTERHLLYVACTRARDHLLVTGVSPVSEFVDDFWKGS